MFLLIGTALFVLGWIFWEIDHWTGCVLLILGGASVVQFLISFFA